MIRSILMALGIFLLILGAESLLVDKVVVEKLHSSAGYQGRSTKQLTFSKCRFSIWKLLPGRAQTGTCRKEVVSYERMDALESLGGRDDYSPLHLLSYTFVIRLATNESLKQVKQFPFD